MLVTMGLKGLKSTDLLVATRFEPQKLSSGKTRSRYV